MGIFLIQGKAIMIEPRLLFYHLGLPYYPSLLI